MNERYVGKLKREPLLCWTNSSDPFGIDNRLYGAVRDAAGVFALRGALSPDLGTGYHNWSMLNKWQKIRVSSFYPSVILLDGALPRFNRRRN